jgi:hypothetical protein
MCVPFLTWSYREGIQLSLWVGQLNPITRFEKTISGHMRILGEELISVGTPGYRRSNGTVKTLT